METAHDVEWEWEWDMEDTEEAEDVEHAVAAGKRVYLTFSSAGHPLPPKILFVRHVISRERVFLSQLIPLISDIWCR